MDAVEALFSVLDYLDPDAWGKLINSIKAAEPHLGVKADSSRLTDPNWLKKNGEKVLPYILQQVDPTDHEIKRLATVGLIKVAPNRLRRHAKLTIRFSSNRWNTNAMRIPDVAATSTALAELYASLIAANMPFDLDLQMPTTRISAGSIDHWIAGAGGLLHGSAFLIGFLPIAGLHVVALPMAIVADVLIIGGEAVAVANAVRKRRKPKASDTQTKDNLDKARDSDGPTKGNGPPILPSDKPSESPEPPLGVSEQVQTHPKESEQVVAHPKQNLGPASVHVKMQTIKTFSSKWKLDLAYSVHLLNRSLPTAVGIKEALPRVKISVISKA